MVWHRQRGGVGCVVVAVVLTACATPMDEPSDTVPTTEPTSTSTTVTTTSTSLPTTTTTSTTTTTTTTSTTTTTTLPEPTALDQLAPFFEEADSLDRAIAAAAQVFNNGFDPEAGTITQEAIDAIQALSGDALFAAIPPGIPKDLRTAALVVYADMTSRIAALSGATWLGGPESVDSAYFCLRLGRNSKARLPGDLEHLETLASETPSFEVEPVNSIAGGVLAVHKEVIRLINWGCGSCGGAVYTTPVEVNWRTRTISDDEGHGSDWELPFTATFDGEQWVIETTAC